MLRNLEQRHTRTPHITRNRVTLPGNAFGRHIVRGANKRVRVTFGTELARNAKVAELDHAVAAEQNVGGLDVAMDDLLAVEVCEAVQDAFGDFAEDFLAGAAAEAFDLAVDGVEGAAFAELHRDGDGGC